MPHSYTPAPHDHPAFARLGSLSVRCARGDCRRIVTYDSAPIFRQGPGNGVEVVMAQWGMVPPGYPGCRPGTGSGWPDNTGVVRSEVLWKRQPFEKAWAEGRRCLIPATTFDEPGQHPNRRFCWEMRRSDRQPWAIAGIWLDWIDPATQAVVPTFAMPTIDASHHPLLRRLFKPDPAEPPHALETRTIVPLEAPCWEEWLQGTHAQAWGLLCAPPAHTFDAFPIPDNSRGNPRNSSRANWRNDWRNRRATA